MAQVQFERFDEIVDLEEVEMDGLERSLFKFMAADLELKLGGLPDALTVVLRIGSTADVGQPVMQLRGPTDLIERAFATLGAIRPS